MSPACPDTAHAGIARSSKTAAGDQAFAGQPAGIVGSEEDRDTGDISCMGLTLPCGLRRTYLQMALRGD
jgi:hypothetical protein